MGKAQVSAEENLWLVSRIPAYNLHRRLQRNLRSTALLRFGLATHIAISICPKKTGQIPPIPPKGPPRLTEAQTYAYCSVNAPLSALPSVAPPTSAPFMPMAHAPARRRPVCRFRIRPPSSRRPASPPSSCPANRPSSVDVAPTRLPAVTAHPSMAHTPASCRLSVRWPVRGRSPNARSARRGAPQGHQLVGRTRHREHHGPSAVRQRGVRGAPTP